MTTCDYAGCDHPAADAHDGWVFCHRHIGAHRRDFHGHGRKHDWAAYTTIRTWVSRLHHTGLTTTEIAAALNVHPTTVRDHIRRLGLPANRTDRQRTRDDRRTREADARISHCPSCNTWRWDNQCRRCDQRTAVAS